MERRERLKGRAVGASHIPHLQSLIMSAKNTSHTDGSSSKPPSESSGTTSNDHESTEASSANEHASEQPHLPHHVFFSPLNYCIPPGQYLFYPQGDLRLQDHRQAEAFDEFCVSAPGFVNEMKDMESKNWITRIITAGFVNRESGQVDLKVTQADYHLPGWHPSSTLDDLQTGLCRRRESTVWRMIRDEMLPPASVQPASEIEAKAPSSDAKAKGCAPRALPSLNYDTEKDLKRGEAAIGDALNTLGGAARALNAWALLGTKTIDVEALRSRIFHDLDAWRATVDKDISDMIDQVTKAPTSSGPGLIHQMEWDRHLRTEALDEACRRWPALLAERTEYEAQGYTTLIDWAQSTNQSGGTEWHMLGLKYGPGNKTTAESINTPIASAYSPRTV